MPISLEEKLARLTQYASDMEVEVRSAHAEACRLAEIADASRAVSHTAVVKANQAFDGVGRLSDRAEAAVEAVAAYKEAMADGTATWDKPATQPAAL